MRNTYPGGKGSCYRQIINRMPPHDVYIEPFLGGGSVMKHKKPASINIGIDKCSDASENFSCSNGTFDGVVHHVINGDGIQYLKEFEFVDSLQTLVYCDPPYVHSTRKDYNLYKHEMTDDDHVELIEVLLDLDCYVMLSGYWSPLYDGYLHTWHHCTFPNTTRQGLVTESLWCNFEPNGVLHDYSYVGDDYRKREGIQRKKNRWVSRLKKMSAVERHYLLEALDEIPVLDPPSLILPMHPGSNVKTEGVSSYG